MRTKLSPKEMVYAALFTAFLAVLGMIPPIPLGFIPVPVTAQTLGVMLAGCFLGRKPAALSMILFIILVALGLPILSGGRGGLGVFVAPSAGYLLSWPVAAYLTGYTVEKLWPKLKFWKLLIVNIVFGVILVSLIGAPVMALITKTSIWAGLISAAVYIPGDIIKAIIAAAVAFQLKVISPVEEKMQ